MKRAVASIIAIAGAAFASSRLLAADLIPYTRGTFAEIRKAHEARPLVVHFWSVTCIPCLVEMPRLAAFAREHADVSFVFVTTDPIAQSERITRRLQKFDLGSAENYAYADTFEERLRFEVDSKWRGELPFTAMIRPGRTPSFIKGELEPAALRDWLETPTR